MNDFLARLLEAAAILGAALGAVLILGALTAPAPQAAAGAAIGIGIAAIPYFLASMLRRAQILAALQNRATPEAQPAPHESDELSSGGF